MYYSSRIILSHDIQMMAGRNINLHVDAWKSISLISYFPGDCQSFLFFIQPATKTICILKTKCSNSQSQMNLGVPRKAKAFSYLTCCSKDQRKLGMGAISQPWNGGQVFGLSLASDDIEYNR